MLASVFVCVGTRTGCRSCRSPEEKEGSNGREESDQWGSAAALLVCHILVFHETLALQEK